MASVPVHEVFTEDRGETFEQFGDALKLAASYGFHKSLTKGAERSSPDSKIE